MDPCVLYLRDDGGSYAIYRYSPGRDAAEFLGECSPAGQVEPVLLLPGHRVIDDGMRGSRRPDGWCSTYFDWPAQRLLRIERPRFPVPVCGPILLGHRSNRMLIHALDDSTAESERALVFLAVGEQVELVGEVPWSLQPLSVAQRRHHASPDGRFVAWIERMRLCWLDLESLCRGNIPYAEPGSRPSNLAWLPNSDAFLFGNFRAGQERSPLRVCRVQGPRRGECAAFAPGARLLDVSPDGLYAAVEDPDAAHPRRRLVPIPGAEPADARWPRTTGYWTLDERGAPIRFYSAATTDITVPPGTPSSGRYEWFRLGLEGVRRLAVAPCPGETGQILSTDRGGRIAIHCRAERSRGASSLEIRVLDFSGREVFRTAADDWMAQALDPWVFVTCREGENWVLKRCDATTGSAEIVARNIVPNSLMIVGRHLLIGRRETDPAGRPETRTLLPELCVSHDAGRTWRVVSNRVCGWAAGRDHVGRGMFW